MPESCAGPSCRSVSASPGGAVNGGEVEPLAVEGAHQRLVGGAQAHCPLDHHLEHGARSSGRCIDDRQHLGVAVCWSSASASFRVALAQARAAGGVRALQLFCSVRPRALLIAACHVRG